MAKPKKQKKSILNDPRYWEYCLRYHNDFTRFVCENSVQKPSWQQHLIMDAVSKPGCKVAIASGHGCFGKGTGVRMFDGTVKPVEDVRIGDVLMGDDWLPRNVLDVVRGREAMYRFTYDNGKSHVFNDSHYLCLIIKATRERVQLPVSTWRWMEAAEREKYVAYRAIAPGVEMQINIVSAVLVDVVGDYYGFEVDGNHHFQAEDGTVFSNTGKSFLMGWYCCWHATVVDPYLALKALHGEVHPDIFSQMLLTANNVDQCRIGVWKYIDSAIAQVENNFPWLQGHFVKDTKRFYNKSFKDLWYVMAKTASKHKPEGVAGQHAKQYTVLIDEASSVEDVIHDILEGALTQDGNRHIMISQPTRSVGRFAEAFGTLKSIYQTFNLNAEESPLVDRPWIEAHLVKYGGHHSPEYQIKVLGRLPDNLSGFLIPKTWLEQSQTDVIVHKEAWGWVATVDVAEGVHRDSSVYTLWKVSGYGPERLAEAIKQVEYLELDELKFAREMYADIGHYPNITFAVDGDGPGRTVILHLEELNCLVERIHWGLPPHTDADKKRYKNQRAFSSVKTREAIFTRRRRLPPGKKVVEQGSRIPYKIDEAGRYVIMPKDQMKGEGIKSPDLFDTVCFVELCDYVPVGDVEQEGQNDLIQAAMRILNGEDMEKKSAAA